MIITHPLTLKDSESYTPGPDKPFSIGMREAGRIIMKKQLDRDYKLTRIEFELESGQFIDEDVPAIIRVYQKDFDSDAKYLIISGAVQHEWDEDLEEYDETRNHYEMTLDLDITSRELTREVIVDGWVPDEWEGWSENSGDYGSRALDTGTAAVGSHINAQPFKGNLQIFGRPLHQIPT